MTSTTTGTTPGTTRATTTAGIPTARLLPERVLPERLDAPTAAGLAASPAGPAAAAADRAPAAPRRRRPWLLRWPAPPYLLAGDALAATACLAVGGGSPAVHAAALLALLVSFEVSGLYRSRASVSVLDDLPRLLTGVLAALAVTLSAAALVPGVPRGRVGEHTAALLVAVVAVRALAYAAIRFSRRHGWVRHTALVVGAGHIGLRLATTMQEHREYGLDPVGFVDASARVEDGAELPVPLFGGYDRLAALIDEYAVRVVVVAFGTIRESELVEVLRTCDRLRCEILMVPRLFEVHPTSRDTDLLQGFPLIRVRRAPFRTPAWRLKRVVDVLFSAAALVVLAPVIGVCALAVRLEGGPRVLFRQERVGLDGRPFEVLKLRSLKPATTEESASTWNIAHDARLGPVGRFLRQTSLDELPQLWNILTGDMSLVGPRPERPLFVQQFSEHVPRYPGRHRVPSGLTGWSQVNGLRGDTSIEERARFDNYYVENWSLWLDVKIIVRTVDQVLRRGGA